MPAENKKIIAIIGAMGAEGHGLVDAILNEGENSDFVPRAITRNAQAERAVALKNRGVEVVQADVNDSDDLAKAIEGAYGMFCMSYFWEYMSPIRELEQIKSMALAAKTADIKHVLWSTQDDTRLKMPSGKMMPMLMGNYFVPQFDVKAEGDRFFNELGLPTTLIIPAFHWESLIFFDMGPKKGPDGKLVLSLPMGQRHLPGIAVEDIGHCCLHILKWPEFIDNRVHLVGDSLTVTEMAEKMTHQLGVEVTCPEVTFDAYRKKDFPGADELTNMFQYYHDCEELEIAAANRIEETRKMSPQLMNFEQWVSKHKSYILPPSMD